MHHDDFAFEPVRGLPEPLPRGEHILWQGSPSPWRLACEAFALRWVAGYFVLLAVWRVGVASAGMPLAQALPLAGPLLVAGLAACLLLLGIATVQARSAVYTLTNRRVAMRIGAALTMTLNLPYPKIGAATLDLRRGGTGTIAFELLDDVRFSYLLTWPHVRPWRMTRTQPALRCIPDAARIARMIADAAEIRASEPVVTRGAPSARPAASASNPVTVIAAE